MGHILTVDKTEELTGRIKVQLPIKQYFFKVKKTLKKVKKIINVFKSQKEILSIVIQFSKQSFKKFLSYLFFFIKFFMPKKILLKIRYRLLRYPKFYQLLKALYIWVYKTPYKSNKISLEPLLTFFICFLFLPLLKIVIKNNKLAMFSLNQLKKNPELFYIIKKLIANDNLSRKQRKFISQTDYLIIKENLSSNTMQIYRDLQVHIFRRLTK